MNRPPFGSKFGTLFGVGVGPGDPELLTVKAHRIITTVPVIAHFAARGRPGNSWRTVAELVSLDQQVERLEYPMTTETVSPDEYESHMAAFYDDACARLAAHLQSGRDVALIAEGDPLFYGSYMHLHARVQNRFHTEVIPGVTAFSAAAAAAGAPLVSLNETFTVVPGVTGRKTLAEQLRSVDAAVIMKVGRHLADVRGAVADAGLSDRAVYVERASCADQRVLPLDDTTDITAPYFSLVLLPGNGLSKRTAAVEGLRSQAEHA